MTTIAGPALITGASGFLGSHLARRLVSLGVDVHVLVRPSSDLHRIDDIRSQLRVWEGELLDTGALRTCLGAVQPGLVFHFAGNTSGRRFDGDWSQVDRAIADNFVGTLSVIRATADSGAPVRSFIRLGGLEEYGAGPTPYSEFQREQPRSPYSASQVAATHWCQMLQPHLGFSVTTLRPALIYGPAQSTDFLIPAAITTLLRGERFLMTSGNQCRDLLYIDDFLDATVAAANHPKLRGAVLNVSTAQEHAMQEVVAMIARQLGSEHLVERGALPPRAGDLLHLIANFNECRIALGWSPRTELVAGLARTIDWYRHQEGAA